jgi:L-amino acid N-acyltransferase YncA
MEDLEIRKARPSDAAGIVAVLEAIVAERVHSAIDPVWPVEQQARYLEALTEREAIYVAVERGGKVVGLQSLDLWSTLLPAMAHVGQVGTFLSSEWRGKGVGRRLWTATTAFAKGAGYRKLLIQVRASNEAARSFYQGLGFRECGRLTRQVVIDGKEDDEVLLEYFFASAC